MIEEAARAPGAGADQRAVSGRTPLVVSALLLVAAGARVWGLAAKSFWFDEAYSLFIASLPVRAMLALLRAYDLHPPLYYLFLHVWVRLFGATEIAARLPSVLASVAAVGVTFLFARRVAGEVVGVLAAGLLAVSPFQVTAAQEARMYPFLTLLAVGSTYALYLALEEKRWRHWVAYGLLMILSLYLHHLSFLILLGHGLFVLGIERRAPATRAWMLCAALILAAYLPQLPTLWDQLTRARTWPTFQTPFRVGLLADVLGLLAFGGRLFGMGTYYREGTLPLVFRTLLILPFLALALYGVVRLPGRRARGLMLAYGLVPLAVTALAAGRWNLFQERYFSFLLPAFDIVVAVGLISLAALQPRRRRAILAVALGTLFVVTMPSLVGAYREQPLYDWRGAAQYVAARAGPEDFVHFVPAFLSIPFDPYFRGRQPRLPLTPDQVLAIAHLAGQHRLLLRTSVPSDQMRLVALRYPRMWMIASVALGPKVHGQIAGALAPYFRRMEVRTFGLVHISLWESRLYGRPNGP